MKFLGLRQIYKITEWRSGNVFKTKHVGYAWVNIDKQQIPNNDGNLQLNSLSTDLLKKLGTKTIKKVDDDAPDFEITTLAQLGIREN